MMPEMSGLELAKRIIAVKSDLPVILASGFSNLLHEEDLKSYGIAAYLNKPILFDELQESVFKVIQEIE